MVSLAIPASGRLVEVDILELSWSPFPHQHGTGAVDSEGIGPKTDTGNGRETIN